MSYYRTVRLGDTDAAGVVYFATTLSICHEAYEASLGGIDFKKLLGGTLALPIVHAEIDFFGPLFCGDALEIDLTQTRLRDDTFQVKYQIFLAKDKTHQVAAALTRHVCIETISRRRMALPEFIVEWLG
jgi:1,4-dihydroxy-2-naphthoyl-CoA hydrolase